MQKFSMRNADKPLKDLSALCSMEPNRKLTTKN